MATYAAYRHIELDNVGYSKKRVSNQSSEIFNVLCSPTSANGKSPLTNGSSHHSPRRSYQHVDSFNRLFGNNQNSRTPPRRASLTKHDVTNRNPVTGNGVDTWDSSKRNSPKVYKERNPVTGETYTIVSPAVTPTKTPQNGFSYSNGNSGASTPTHNGKNHFEPTTPIKITAVAAAVSKVASKAAVVSNPTVPTIITNGNTNGHVNGNV